MGIVTWSVLSYHMRWKRALTRLHARHDCQSSLKPAQEHLIGSLTRNLLTAHWELTGCDENSWSAHLCFVIVTPFYEPITEVVLLTCYLCGCKVNPFIIYRQKNVHHLLVTGFSMSLPRKCWGNWHLVLHFRLTLTPASREFTWNVMFYVLNLYWCHKICCRSKFALKRSSTNCH